MRNNDAQEWIAFLLFIFLCGVLFSPVIIMKLKELDEESVNISSDYAYLDAQLKRFEDELFQAQKILEALETTNPSSTRFAELWPSLKERLTELDEIKRIIARSVDSETNHATIYADVTSRVEKLKADIQDFYRELNGTSSVVGSSELRSRDIF